jgi:H+/Cl- antiporter ClcA
MVVMFGSIIKGYWSGLLLVADMSGAYNVILLPGIIAGGISFLISWKLHDRSIFDLPLAAEQAALEIELNEAERPLVEAVSLETIQDPGSE